ncbi:MAG: hypothetical protein KGD57_10430 [Candidatus Lokiarchaeota archaeon]|nr:hypothetical protein [Candidatus Lokiarchaeota archaeon]
MISSGNILKIKGRISSIPIRQIPEPFCKKCMNIEEKKKELCSECESPIFIDNWHFNKVKALGIYNSYEHNGYKVPINILSELIYNLKFRRKKPKKAAGKIIADGLFQIFQQNANLFQDTAYLAISPKYKGALEDNNCFHIIKPLLEKMEKSGFNIQNIANNTERIKDVGDNKIKNKERRFKDINGVHQINLEDLGGKKVLIIDDVFATGSTVWDLSRALKEKNAGEINVLVAGRYCLFNEWPIKQLKYQGLSFNTLLLYFSQLDMDLKRLLSNF